MAMLINPTAGSAATAGFPNPSYYLGAFSGSNPSASVNGQWWYRIDLNTIYQYINGHVVPVMPGGPTTIILGSVTIGGADVVIDQDVIVLPSSTLVTYGSIFFARGLKVVNGGTWLSSNPNASSTALQTNNYIIYEGAYIDGQYIIDPYNNDSISAASISYMLSSGTITINGILTVLNSYTIAQDLVGSGTLNIPSGYTLTLNNNYSLSMAIVGSGTLNIPSGYTLTLNNNYSLSMAIVGSGTLNIPSGYTLTTENAILSVSSLVGGGYIYSVTNTILNRQVMPNSITFQIFTSQTLTSTPSYNMLVAAPATVVVSASLPNYVILYSPRSILVSYLSSYPAASTSDTFSPTSWVGNVKIYGSGIAIFSVTNAISGTPNELSLNNVSISPSSNDGSAAGAGVGGGLGYTLTAVAGSATGYYILEIYGSNGWYYPYLIYIGTASYTYSLPSITIGSGTCCSTPSGYNSYARNGANSVGTITISGILYGG